jgi:putative acetyltransferase
VERDGKIAGFMGLAYQKVEMLFVDPQFFDQGSLIQNLQKLFMAGYPHGG